MSRAFFTSIPALFIPEELAKIEAVRNDGWYTYELKNPKGSLNRAAFDSPWKRVNPAFGGWEGLVSDEQHDEYCYAHDLAEFMDLRHGIWKGVITEDRELAYSQQLENSLRDREPKFPKVAAILTVDQAKAAAESNWA